MWDGQVWGIHELFPELPADPEQAKIQVRNDVSQKLSKLVQDYFLPLVEPIWQKRRDSRMDKQPMSEEQAQATWEKVSKPPLQEFNRTVRDVQQRLLDQEDGKALPVWKDIIKDSLRVGLQHCDYWLKHALDEDIGFHTYDPGPDIPTYDPVPDLTAALEAIAREVAKLDGFDVDLRSLAIDQTSDLNAPKHWVIPVREWARDEDWRDGELVASHDENGLVRPQYVKAMLAAKLYDEKGALKNGLLDPDCIEARDWNLSAGQYKPFDFTQLKSDKSVSELIGELRATEQQIIGGLDKLLAMVEGRE